MTGERRKEAAAPLEWLAAAIGLLIFAGLFATIFASGAEQDRQSVPDLMIENRRLVPVSSGSLVEFDIRNRSSRTAAAVVVEGRLAGLAGQEAAATVTVDYVPARSRVRAGLMFPGDVRGRPIEIRAVGYREP